MIIRVISEEDYHARMHSAYQRIREECDDPEAVTVRWHEVWPTLIYDDEKIEVPDE